MTSYFPNMISSKKQIKRKMSGPATTPTNNNNNLISLTKSSSFSIGTDTNKSSNHRFKTNNHSKYRNILDLPLFGLNQSNKYNIFPLASPKSAELEKYYNSNYYNVSMDSIPSNYSISNIHHSQLNYLSTDTINRNNNNNNNNNNVVNNNNNKNNNKFLYILPYLDIKEVIGFLGWFFIILGTVIIGVILWVLFFEFIIRPIHTNNNNNNILSFGILWFFLITFFLFLRHKLRKHYFPISIKKIANHAELFVSISLIMTFCTNIAFYFHTQSIEPLYDIGFILISKQNKNSIWKSFSDIMTIFLPIFCALNSIFMKRENRVIIFCTFFRIASICYILRSITVPLTSLPGPAPHCRPGSLEYNPPDHWIDIVTRIGPMHGKFNTCGDLIFSGHMCYTNSALLLYLRTLDRYYLNKKYSYIRWFIGVFYLLMVAYLCIAGRKHYSVDIVLGIMISTLVYFHFEHSWIPPSLNNNHININKLNNIHSYMDKDNSIQNQYNNILNNNNNINDHYNNNNINLHNIQSDIELNINNNKYFIPYDMLNKSNMENNIILNDFKLRKLEQNPAEDDMIIDEELGLL